MLYPELVASINNKTLISPFAFPTETVFGIFHHIISMNSLPKYMK